MLCPEFCGISHCSHAHIARAQQGAVAVPHFVLQLAIAAEVPQVVPGEGVPQYIRYPALKPG